MRYITRELYESIQAMLGMPQKEAKETSRRWDEACQSYQSELSTIKSSLPPSMRSFADITLHDGVVTLVAQRPGCVVLRIDATSNPWGSTGWFRVEFKGVRQVEGLAEMIGDDWLYEEVHLHPS